MPIYYNGKIVAGSGGSSISGGVDIPASDTPPAEGNYWLDISEEGEVSVTSSDFIVTFSITDNLEYVPDKTHAEILKAAEEGKAIKGIGLYKDNDLFTYFALPIVSIDNGSMVITFEGRLFEEGIRLTVKENSSVEETNFSIATKADIEAAIGDAIGGSH